MTASIILSLFIFWKILKAVSDMEVDDYWQRHLRGLLRLESYLKIKSVRSSCRTANCRKSCQTL